MNIITLELRKSQKFFCTNKTAEAQKGLCLMIKTLFASLLLLDTVYHPRRCLHRTVQGNALQQSMVLP